jgi:hypothetical protein
LSRPSFYKNSKLALCNLELYPIKSIVKKNRMILSLNEKRPEIIRSFIYIISYNPLSKASISASAESLSEVEPESTTGAASGAGATVS